MNTRSEWCVDANSFQDIFYTKEETVESVKSNYDIRRYNSAEGVSVTIDGITEQVIIQDHHNPINESDIDKKLLLPIDTIAKTGSLVVFENQNWLINSRINNVDGAYKSCQIQYCNYILKFQHPTTGAILSYPCITSSTRLGQEENKFMTLGNNQKSIVISQDESTILFGIDKRLYVDAYNKQVYKIISIDNTSHNGLIELIVEQDLIQNTGEYPDRPDLGVCNYISPITPVDLPDGDTYSAINTSDLIIGINNQITPTFYNADGTENSTVVAVWYITKPEGFESDVAISYNGNICNIKLADNTDLLGKKIIATVSDESGGFESTTELIIGMGW